ncbi:hypothetical protein V6N11_022426 [Hibiscus sabdariffa]|uniref:Reverse transcriptase zinc-binding domain-containing protein n=1 Tax=Hibiscus sabdariffa TaxID=183260 RepID=A0ABR2TJH5_9ROSI
MKGGNFTWSNHRSEDNAILEKLGRTIVSSEWNSLFPKSVGFIDIAMASDHTPLVLLLQGLNKDNWIPKISYHKVASPKPGWSRDITVSHLLKDNSRTWDHQKIERLFTQTEMEAILAIPIEGPTVCDTLILTGTKNGEYSVKSGYHLLSNSLLSEDKSSESHDLSQNQQLWGSIWSLNVPPKVRKFLWKLCHNILPTKGNLHDRFHGTFYASSMCPRCGIDKETVEHLFFFLPFCTNHLHC